MRPLQGLPGYEAGVMLAERRGQVIAVELGPTGRLSHGPHARQQRDDDDEFGDDDD